MAEWDDHFNCLSRVYAAASQYKTFHTESHDELRRNIERVREILCEFSSKKRLKLLMNIRTKTAKTRVTRSVLCVYLNALRIVKPDH